MRICLVAIGSTGDVAPLLAVARRLQDEGHAVTVATHAPFETWVTGLRLGYARLPMDPRAELTEERAQAMRRGPMRAAKVVQEAFAPFVHELAWTIDRTADTADLMLLSAMAWTGYHSAVARGIPSLGLHLQPLEPTAAFPPPAAPVRSLGRRGNRALGRLVQRQMVGPYLTVVNAIRTTHSLAPITVGEHVAELEARQWPVLIGVSPHLVPAPEDWRPGVRTVGSWQPPVLPGWEPDPALVDFVDSGPAPVYFGFGSTSPASPERLGDLVTAVVRQAKVRAVVATGWSGMHVGECDDIHAVESVDHHWLLARTSAAVHHAGAGTTAAAARAGVVSVPVPLGMDQPFWASRLRAQEAATSAVPAARLTARRLADALSEAASSAALRDGARRLGQHVRREDGLAAVVQEVERIAT